MNIAYIFKRLFTEDSWKCAYRLIENNEDNIEERVKKKCKYSVVKIPKRFWIADPFLFKKNGEMYAFFEIYDRFKSKAALGCTLLADENAPIYIIFEYAGHSSYPCIFEENGEVYIIPETASEGRVSLLKCVQWPNKWEEAGTLLKQDRMVDSTVFCSPEKTSLFLYQRNKENAILSIADINTSKCTIENMRELISYNRGEGRPGGGIIKCGSFYYRVVQPMRNYYGEKIELFRIESLSSSYMESFVGEIVPSDIEVDKSKKIDGIHTFNRCEKYEIIDVLIRNKLTLLKPLYLCLKFFSVGSFDLGDKRNKKCFKTIIERKK